MTYDTWKATDTLDLGCAHVMCKHGLCVNCDDPCPTCVHEGQAEDDDDWRRELARERYEGAADTDLIVERERRAWKLQQQMEGETWQR